MWARELKGMNESEQIRHLRKLLSDLGMTGRLSMEKAKQIKEQRELAKELRSYLFLLSVFNCFMCKL